MRKDFFFFVIMTTVLKQSRRCADLLLTDAIDFLKVLRGWGVRGGAIGDVIVINQKCLILSQYKEN